MQAWFTTTLASVVRKRVDVGVRFVAGSDVRGYNSDVRGYNSDVRGYNSDVRGYNSDVRGYTSDVRGYNSDVSMRSVAGSGVIVE